MHRALISAGVAIVGTSLVAVPPAAPPIPDVQVRSVQLTSGDSADSALGGGIASVMGGSGIPIPPQQYVDAADALYLQPRGFTGTPEALFTPEGLYPATGVKSLTADASLAQGQQILDAVIHGHIADGNVDVANPVVVFGYSQSSAIASLTMEQLRNQGVPSDDVHFVLVGDTSAPNGGLLERFDVPTGTDPSVPSLGITFGGATPDNLYPTDVYTLEYDGFADFPRYPLDLLSDLNAFAGITYEHLTYLDLTSEQIQDAIPLATTGDTLTHYYMIPAENLPLLEPLRLLPVVGNPLADLLQPDLKVLVNLGYGQIQHGWDPGFANVPTGFGLSPTNLNWSDVLTALVNGVPQGIQAAIKDLEDPANYQITPILDNPSLSALVAAAYTSGLTDTLHPSLWELVKAMLSNLANFPISDATLLSSPTAIINDLTATLSADTATLLPLVDTVIALRDTLPAYDASIFMDQLEAGNLLGAIGDPIAADMALVPFAISFGAALPLVAAAGGTLVNLLDLIP